MKPKNVFGIVLWIFFLLAVLLLLFGIGYYCHIKNTQTDYVTQVENNLKEPQSTVSSKNKKEPVATNYNDTQKEAAPSGIALLTFKDTKTKLPKKIAVNEGSDASSLANGAGWDTTTSVPGEEGNCVIYGHRDTSFALLKDVCIDQRILCKTASQTTVYRICSIRITKPNASSIYDFEKDTAALEAVLTDTSTADVNSPNSKEAQKALHDISILTLVTCHPFTFVGSSPNRCIVTAVLDD